MERKCKCGKTLPNQYMEMVECFNCAYRKYEDTFTCLQFEDETDLKELEDGYSIPSRHVS